MSEAYGNAFTNQFGDEPNITWSSGLSTYDLEDIQAAVGSLITSGERYAPNLATVIGRIEQDSGWEHSRQSRPAHEVLSAPIIDKGQNRYLDDPDSMKARELGTPDSNPDYFSNLMAGFQ